MKQTVNKYDFHHAFEQIRPDNFSYQALDQLFDYFEELEQDIGEEIELDVIAICCEWSESTISEFMTDYGLEDNELDSRDTVQNYIEENGGAFFWVADSATDSEWRIVYQSF